MSEWLRWGAYVGVIVAFCLLLHFLATLFSPRSEGDSRLGPVGFWVWVALTALFVHFVLDRHPMPQPGPLPLPVWLRVAGNLLLSGLWLGWRFDLFESETLRTSQEEHEEAWASLVGVAAGVFVVPLIISAARRLA